MTTDQLLNWHPVRVPEHKPIIGRHVSLRPVDPASHAAELFRAAQVDAEETWRFLFYGPFADLADFRAYLDPMAESTDPLFFTVVETGSARLSGIVSYLRITPDHGVIEIGHIWFAPWLQRTRGATEAIYLLARHAFDDLGYRRLEWKCNAENQRSRRAAERFGFTFEGIFRQHVVAKDRNRDTAWYAMLDRDWPLARKGFERWLAEDNFDVSGGQIHDLASIRDQVRRNRSEQSAPGLSIRSAEKGDEAVWRQLWLAYTTFYEESVPESTTSATWRRICDPRSAISCLLAVGPDGTVVGFANIVVHEYTWSDRPECLMEDLFVRPEARGQGVGRALIGHIIDLARTNRWAKVYWITKQDNVRARRLYDTFTPPDGFIEYSLALED